MKKLNHPNLVALYEVLDDPADDSLYMVLEMCKKGVVMQVGFDDRKAPYDEEQCRHFFRDLILGIEYRTPRSSLSGSIFLRRPDWAISTDRVRSTCSSRARRRPPRHQARQLPDHARRRPQGGRLWRVRDVRKDVGDADRKVGRIAGVPAPRGVRDPARRHLRKGGGHLVDGRDALLSLLRPDPVREARRAGTLRRHPLRGRSDRVGHRPRSAPSLPAALGEGPEQTDRDGGTSGEWKPKAIYPSSGGRALIDAATRHILGSPRAARTRCSRKRRTRQTWSSRRRRRRCSRPSRGTSDIC